MGVLGRTLQGLIVRPARHHKQKPRAYATRGFTLRRSRIWRGCTGKGSAALTATDAPRFQTRHDWHGGRAVCQPVAYKTRPFTTFSGRPNGRRSRSAAGYAFPPTGPRMVRRLGTAAAPDTSTVILVLGVVRAKLRRGKDSTNCASSNHLAGGGRFGLAARSTLFVNTGLPIVSFAERRRVQRGSSMPNSFAVFKK